ncbi:MAG TPA: carboxypeptidase regulatory-like domain-containing protein [Pyrinomonadaceae bacterium]|jgi:outer membrane receptor protein involved in Fe transport|nr:carboxypeptidase regulatory-like domain-containing protein [Pyrinomonadaceae bacterium]
MHNKSFLFSRRSWLALAVALLAVFSLPTATSAQLTRGSIAGTVSDQSGAAVPGAEVRVTNPGTSISRVVTTNDEGFYRVGALDPGTYTVTIEKAGFSKVENTQVVVQPSLEATFDTQLRVGAVTEIVNVTATAEGITLNKTNPTIGLTVEERQVEELPTSAARNINNLALLSPNVHLAPGSTGISANGQRARNNNFTIDGSDNNDISITVSTTPVFPEAVGQFQIQTNPYSVEFGRNSGAQINVITKSGTNSFHGDIFEFYRGSRLNALDNREKANGLTRPSRFNRNQYGFTLGGPLHLPRFGEGSPDDAYISGRDRTHFFFGYQGDKTRSSGVLQAAVTIPTAVGFGALSSVPLRAGQSTASRQAVLSQLSFLSGVYGQNPVFSNIQNVTVNGVPIQFGTTNLGVSQPNDTNTFIARVDQRLGANDTFTIRYISNKANDPNVTSNLTFGERFAAAQTLYDQNAALSETHVFSPTVLNEFRGSYIRRNLNFPENDTETLTVQVGGTTCAFFCFGGASNFPQSRVTNYYQLSDTLSWTAGNHGLKFGADIRFNQLFNKSGFDLKGTYNFTNFADYLNNNAFSFAQAVSATNFLAEQIQQFYFVQDDWRVTPNLTLNLGLRYETAGVPLGFFGDPDRSRAAFAIPGPVQRDNNNFGPAFGFAYSPRPSEGSFMHTLFGDGRSVIRGGYRISYDLLFYNILVVNAGNFPFTSTNSVNNVVDQFPAKVAVTAPAFNPLNQFINTQEDARTPYSQLYSLSFQRELFRDYQLEIGYSGSRAVDQVRQLQMNPALLSDAQAATVRARGTIPSVQNRRLNTAAGVRVLIGPGAQSTYNSAYVSLNKRFSRGLQFGASYTFSKNMSNNDESLGVAAITASSPQAPQDTFQLDREKSLSAFDRTHRFVTNYIYEAPAPWFARDNAFLRQVFGGWQISGITSAQSGQPFTVFTGVDTNGNGSTAGDRPNFNPNGPIFPDPVSGNFRTFTIDPNNPAFLAPRLNTANTAGPLVFTGTGAIQANSLGNGNLGRNTFRGPGFWNTNLSVAKNFRFGEDKRIRISADFLNAFNQDNYGNPTTNMNSTNFGKNLNNWGNRSITLGGKFSF